MIAQLTTTDVATIVGIKPGTVRRYVNNRSMPPPDGMVGRTPWWTRETIEAWVAGRPGQNWRGKS